MRNTQTRLVQTAAVALLLSMQAATAGQAWDPDGRYSDFGYPQYSQGGVQGSRHSSDYWTDRQGRLPTYRDRATGAIVVPSRIVTIAPREGDELSPECRNVYNVLTESNHCNIDDASRRKIAGDFYRVGRMYLEFPGDGDTRINVGPDVRFVMGCLRRSPNQAAFEDCLRL